MEKNAGAAGTSNNTLTPNPSPIGWERGTVPFVGVCGGGFEGAERGSADGDNTAMFLFCSVDRTGSFLADVEALLVHQMGGKGLGFDGGEGAETDMEGEETNVDAEGADFVQERLAEVQAGSGRSDGAGGLGEDGLVALAIEFHLAGVGAVDIWRQRD